MLIYVNKKKERYQKIKTFSLILCCVFVFVINISVFKNSIHTPIQNLAQYKSLKISQNWYDKAQTATIFSNKKSTQSVIIIPQKLNKENFITTAAAIYKVITKETQISYTGDVKQTELLKKITEALPVDDSKNTNKNLLITTDIKYAKPLIFTHKLYPQIINYKQAQKQEITKSLRPLLNTIFPDPSVPNTSLDKDKERLKTFAKDYAKELKNIISSKNPPSFPTQNLFLQNARICLQNKNRTTCRISKELSLEKNLIKALNNFSKETPPEKLIFLTSEQKINSGESLNSDEGLHFRFGSKEEILLPQQISTLAKPSDAFYILKKRAGLNPDYVAPDMTFYKFKTMEINLNDNI